MSSQIDFSNKVNQVCGQSKQNSTVPTTTSQAPPSQPSPVLTINGDQQSTPSSTPTPTNTTTPTPTPPACGISKSGSYSGNDYHQYPTQTLNDAMDEYITFSWNSYDRPNRFTVYDSVGLRWTSGWVGTANYPGPWGSSLNTAQSGSANICFLSLTGRYVLVEAGAASPTTPISDTYDWSIACNGLCPSVTPTPTITQTQTPSNTQTKTPTPTPTNQSCNISKSGSYAGNDYYAYPNQNLSNNMSEYITFNWNSYDRPNRFTVYDSVGLRWTSGWVGTASYSGPWGASLSTAQSGSPNICFLSTTGRYVLVEAGPASPTTPISDTYDWSITCQGLCPSVTPTQTYTPTVTPSNTITATNTPTPTQGSCNAANSGSYTGNDYHQYPNYNLSDSFYLYSYFSWNSYDRPNRFNVYDSSGLVWSSGWVGTASYPGPWGPSLSTSESGLSYICFLMCE